MTKKIFTLALLATTLVANAQIDFNKVSDVKTLDVSANAYLTDKSIAFSTEQVNGKDMKFTIWADDFSVKKTFTIPDLGKFDSTNSYFEYLVTLYIESGYDIDEALLTQTFFNDDDAYEVLRPVLEKNPSGTYPEYVVKGCEVVSENGDVLGEVPFELLTDDYTDAYLKVFSIGKANYVLYSHEVNEDYVYSIYRVSASQSGSVSFEKVNNSFAFPNPVKRNDALTVHVSDLNLSDGSYVEISNLNGQVVNRQMVEPGKTEASISTRRLHSGQYIYSVISGGNVVESGKIIVK